MDQIQADEVKVLICVGC